MSKNKNKVNRANIAILGASGYTGVEAIRLLANNHNYNIIGLTADSKAGKSISEVYPQFSGMNLPYLKKIEDINFSQVDAIISCLPHGKTQKILSDIPRHIKICDLSADFRFEDIYTYEDVYGKKHEARELQEEAIYGLTEINRKKIKNARFVSNPGCYPTSALLPILPLIDNNIIQCGNIVVDSKSGVSGAGRTLKENLLFGEVSDGFSAYGLVNHRHRPEIQNQIHKIGSTEYKVLFTPHLLPIKRGILSTIYLNINDKLSIIVENLENGKIVASINPDKRLKSASTIKVPILHAYMIQLIDGVISVNSNHKELIKDMIRFSSNSSTNTVIELLGGPAKIQRILEQTNIGVNKSTSKPSSARRRPP